MNFQESVKCKLSCYKKNKFPKILEGTYRGKPYEHILPKTHQEENFIETYRKDIIHSKLYDPKKLHIYFSHLNSSQAMCFNFFYPLYHENKLELVTDSLGLLNETVNYETVCFEKDGKDGEGHRRPTSFDFFFETTSKKKIFFEIKYTENEFGRAKDDPDHTDKFDNFYSKHLKPLNEKFKKKDEFLKNYQICRNLIHIENDCFVVFIYPKDNKKISEGAKKAKSEILINDFIDNFFPTTWETLFYNILKSTTETKLKSQLDEFRIKYL